MSGELVRYAKNALTTKQAKETAATARRTYDVVSQAALEAEGALALAGHIMDGLVGLDERRKSLSNGDPITDVMLTEIQVTAVRAVKQIQADLYNEWGK